MPRRALPMLAAKSCVGCSDGPSSDGEQVMSRVGKYPVEIPAGVQVAIAGGILTAKGKLGELSLALTDHVEAKIDGNHVTVAPRTSAQQARMMWGTTRAL